MECRECKGLFSDNLMTSGLCRACTPNTPRYNSNLTIDEHDTLKAKAELFDGLVSYVTNDHNALNNSMWERQVLTKLKQVIAKAKEIK